MLVTQIATAAAAIGWVTVEWITHKRASVLGIASGAIAGLVAVTPAAGTAGPGGALVLGLIAGAVCFFSATKLKRRFGYDDALDVIGVHLDRSQPCFLSGDGGVHAAAMQQLHLR